jgi:membrane protein YqaA with SNARE-associated domain
MRALFYSFLGYFLTPAGLVLLAAFDSSMVFFLPLGIDFVVILLAARKPELFWMYAVLATIGSIAGAAGTFWIGRKVGEHGLSRFVKASRLKRVQERVGNSAAVTVGALAIIPPPFPFTAFVLTCGAAHVNAWTFFVTLGAVRTVRFLAEGALAAHYGKGIIGWMQSTTFTVIVGSMAAIAVIGTIVSAIALYRSAKRDHTTTPRRAESSDAPRRTQRVRS